MIGAGGVERYQAATHPEEVLHYCCHHLAWEQVAVRLVWVEQGLLPSSLCACCIIPWEADMIKHPQNKVMFVDQKSGYKCEIKCSAMPAWSLLWLCYHSKDPPLLQLKLQGPVSC